MSKATKFLQEIRTYDAARLEKEIAARYETIRTLRFGIGFGTTTSLAQLRQAKRELAHLLTVLNEKQAAGAKE